MQESNEQLQRENAQQRKETQKLKQQLDDYKVLSCDYEAIKMHLAETESALRYAQAQAQTASQNALSQAEVAKLENEIATLQQLRNFDKQSNKTLQKELENARAKLREAQQALPSSAQPSPIRQATFIERQSNVRKNTSPRVSQAQTSSLSLQETIEHPRPKLKLSRAFDTFDERRVQSITA